MSQSRHTRCQAVAYDTYRGPAMPLSPIVRPRAPQVSDLQTHRQSLSCLSNAVTLDGLEFVVERG